MGKDYPNSVVLKAIINKIFLKRCEQIRHNTEVKTHNSEVEGNNVARAVFL